MQHSEPDGAPFKGMVTRTRATRQVSAARKMIRALEIKPEHQALKEVVLGLAAAVDEEPKNAALWREFRAAVSDLREATANNSDDDTTSFLLSIKTPRVQPKVGDT